MAPWARVNGEVLNQGDLLLDLAVPILHSSFPVPDANGEIPIEISPINAVVMSQSCDLEQLKIANVVVAQAFSLDEFEAENPNYKPKGRWKDAARGRVEALHLLPPTEEHDNPRRWLIVDFRAIYSLPFGYVENAARAAGGRWRLQSPYTENLSQAFGRFFMRVALPTEPPQDFSAT
jgi:hypothetical protein